MKDYQSVPSFDLEYSQPEGSKSKRRYWITGLVASGLTLTALSIGFILYANGVNNNVLMSSSMSVCKDPHYSKTTLKTAHEGSFIALMKDTKHQKKFEASDVIVVNDDYYAVCDNSWAIEKISSKMTPYSSDNIQIGDPNREKDDSGYEAIFHDAETDLFYIVRESVELDLGGRRKEYHAIVEEVVITGDDYTVTRSCPSELEFEGASKGFEGAVGLKSASGEMYMLGLCEGNHCLEGKQGRDKGNGLVVVMKLETNEDEVKNEPGCVWKTVRTMSIPSSAFFQDYSAISINSNGRVAITSQEESQVWIGYITHMEDGFFNPHRSEFDKVDYKVLDFPRDTNCQVIYCNIEGIHWVNDELLVGVSDKMKEGGKQDFRCLAKDQSIHMFVLP